ncbi:hypothetical protein [Acinetobacter baumannii]|uniref:hypothetical protein n=1 Tax=Acinetobacter baumannii TaxID=470 RepID=UPI00244A1764|nr:hypothetical protein [Acinetobacter baumannii]MDH2463948.1 hypothetical protein [Acinetobacter baumannii]
MKPEQFIREFGVEKAREVVEGAPVQPFGYDFIDHDYFDGADIQDGYSIEQCDGCVFVPDLKRLVESLDLIKKLGGLQGAKAYVPDGYKSDRLKQAIRDHESIYGGGESHAN